MIFDQTKRIIYGQMLFAFCLSENREKNMPRSFYSMLDSNLVYSYIFAMTFLFQITISWYSDKKKTKRCVTFYLLTKPLQQHRCSYTTTRKMWRICWDNSNNINSTARTSYKTTSTRHNLFDFEFFKCFILTNRNHKNNLFLCITTRHLCYIWRPPRDRGIILSLPHQKNSYIFLGVSKWIIWNFCSVWIYNRRESWYKRGFRWKPNETLFKYAVWWFSNNARRWWGGC